MLKRTFLFLLTTVALAFGMAGCDYARAQDALVVSVCGTLPLAYAPGATRPVTVDIHGQTCSAAPSPVANQAVDIQKILGAAPSLTNPLWVFPATGATFPVSGTFWQATQPVSLATAPTTPVTGTFWQATQPVTGTFYQATQPVSLATAPTTPVTGTFWQATQPVSIASMPSTPVTGTFWQTTQPVSGTFYQATQPVSVAAAPLNAIGITPTDRTITSATGASQTLMAANAARHSLTVENTGNANCGVNPTGGTAAIGGAGTLTLVPNGSYQPRIPSVSAVTIICTSSQPIYGEEN
jgi:hypothetical protein